MSATLRQIRDMLALHQGYELDPPAIALTNLVRLRGSEVVMNLPSADMLAIYQESEFPAFELTKLVEFGGSEIVMSFPTADMCMIFYRSRDPAFNLTRFVGHGGLNVATKMYDENSNARLFRRLSHLPIVQSIKEQLLKKANKSNATAIALQEIHQKLKLNDVPAVVTGITLAYLQHKSVSQKAEEITDNKTLQEIQKTAKNLKSENQRKAKPITRRLSC